MVRALCFVLLMLAACKKAETADAPLNKLETKPAGTLVAPPERKAPRAKPAQLTHVTLKALGMFCEESCPLKVRTALADIPAVYELGFDVSNEAIFVSYDSSLGPAKEVTKPMLVAIKGAGFDPWLSKESWPETADDAVAVVP